MKKDTRTYENVVDAIGQTPMIMLNKIPSENGVKCSIYAKCDYLNPGGSSKDRICLFMILAAEKEGKIKPGDTLVESTSGNTGIGLALVALVRGYKLITTIPDKMSKEKINTLKAMGTEVIITPTQLDSDDPNSYVGVAKRLGQLPNHFWINQYYNKANVQAHYETTGPEIFEQMNGKIDYMFIAAGTCGTITGCAKRFKELDPNIKVIGVDPVGSVLAIPDTLNSVSKSYKIEGIG